MVSSPPRSLRRLSGYTALGLAAILLVHPPGASAHVAVADDTPPLVSYTIDGIVGSNGWYRGISLTQKFIVVHWTVSDPDSPILSTTGCEPAIQINDPNTGTTRTCSATSDGGTTTVTTKTLKVDATAPVASTAAPARGPDKNNWYNHAVSIQWSGSDSTSGIASCTSSTYSGPDSGTASTSGTCTDNAGNMSTPLSFGLAYDDSGPTSVAVTPARAADHAGWYTHSVGLQWHGADAVSGIDSCSASTYNGPDNANAALSGSCTDKAGNTTTSTFGLSYDASAPTGVSASAARSPDHNGWFNHGVGLTWTGNDATSGIDFCTGITYSGPDSATASASGTCTDRAGNTSGPTSLSFKYDDTAPSASASPARSPDHSGWYNHALGITWNGTDPTSGIDSCTSTTYSGPDSANGSASGSCTDKAGNTSAGASFSLKYDDTAPTVSVSARSPDHAGWYNHPLPISWSGSDATAGIESCTSTTYSGPDVDGGSTSGTCTDKAGNTSLPLAFGLSYDDTPPAVTVAASRGPDDNGWYNQPVGISWSGSDATSGIDSCTPPVTYSGPDSKNASSAGHCTDRAGNTGTPPPLSIKYDATPPVATAAPSRGPDANGWYNRRLTISWSSSGSVSGIASCSSTAYAGPDSGSVSRSGTCTDGAGNTSAAVPFSFRFDATPPTGVAASPTRPPDHGGWYNRPLGVRWTGADTLSGIAGCSSMTYSGPATGASVLSGGCTDRAGNTAARGFAVKYDQSPPRLTGIVAQARDGVVKLRWRLAGGADVAISRSPGRNAGKTTVYDGSGSAFADRSVENYTRYRYTLTGEDEAGNTIARSAVATPRPALFAPRPGAHLGVHAASLFAWRPVPTARYYNVQLWLDGRAIGSWWPGRERLRLPSRWRFRGQAHQLEAGAYTWYVWPGRGPRKVGRYGLLLGKSTFVVG